MFLNKLKSKLLKLENEFVWGNTRCKFARCSIAIYFLAPYSFFFPSSNFSLLKILMVFQFECFYNEILILALFCFIFVFTLSWYLAIRLIEPFQVSSKYSFLCRIFVCSWGYNCQNYTEALEGALGQVFVLIVLCIHFLGVF